MTENQTTQPTTLNARLLVSGVLLMAAGGVIGFTGLAVSSGAVLAAVRRWVKQMDVPPSELARQKWAQARAATSAGVGAWRDGQPADQAP